MICCFELNGDKLVSYVFLERDIALVIWYTSFSYIYVTYCYIKKEFNQRFITVYYYRIISIFDNLLSIFYVRN